MESEKNETSEILINSLGKWLEEKYPELVARIQKERANETSK